jgi:hypothetical protein
MYFITSPPPPPSAYNLQDFCVREALLKNTILITVESTIRQKNYFYLSILKKS